MTFERFARVETERLVLRAASVAEEDVAGLYAVTSDPESWRHDPAGRHTEPAVTRDWLERAAARWETDGLSYWLVRLRGTDAVIGAGGVQRHRSGEGWNLYYRLAPAAWGRGYATELSRTAIEAARSVEPGLPVMAWILEHNAASRRVAERLGLTDRGERVDANDGVRRLLYTDR